MTMGTTGPRSASPRPVSYAAVSVLGLTLAASPVAAGSLWLSAECDAASTDLGLSVEDTGEQPEVVGFDLHRVTLGDCESEVRVTSEVLPRRGVGAYLLTHTDTDVTGDVAYHYWVSPVDADRKHVETDPGAFDYSASSFNAIGVCGNAVIMHGRLWSSAPRSSADASRGLVWLDSCTDSCYLHSPFISIAPEMNEIVDSEIYVKLFGTPSCNFEGCTMDAFAYLEARCVVTPVLPSTWGNVKARFR